MKQNQSESGRKLLDLFSEADLHAITRVTKYAEANTSGEIRVKIRMKYDRVWADDLDGQAIHDFYEEGLDRTAGKTGVLVLVIMAERKLKILADIGICEKLPQSFWDDTANNMAQMFKHGKYVDGLCDAVTEIGRQLEKFFPRKPDDVNELSDRSILEDGS